MNLTSFKESGASEYSSDVLLGLQYDGMDYREEETDKTREKRIRLLLKQMTEQAKQGQAQQIQVKILKHRNGCKGEALFDFYPMFNCFLEHNGLADTTEPDKQGWHSAKGHYPW